MVNLTGRLNKVMFWFLIKVMIIFFLILAIVLVSHGFRFYSSHRIKTINWQPRIVK